MPTGSFAPDSASRIVPVRPDTSRRPSTENMTAGSVGAIAAPIRPDVVHEKSEQPVRRERDDPRGRECPEHAEQQHGHAGRAQAAQSDARAAVEEDDDERDDADPLDGPDRELAERGEDVREHGRGEQEERRARQPDALADAGSRATASAKARRDEEHDQPEVRAPRARAGC